MYLPSSFFRYDEKLYAWGQSLQAVHHLGKAYKEWVNQPIISKEGPHVPLPRSFVPTAAWPNPLPVYNQPSGGVTSCTKLEGKVVWISVSLTVFFASLKCFSCINLAMIDHDDGIVDESKGWPLMLSVHNSSMPHRSDDPAFE